MSNRPKNYTALSGTGMIGDALIYHFVGARVQVTTFKCGDIRDLRIVSFESLCKAQEKRTIATSRGPKNRT
jgi:hypothetical protein